MSQARKPLRVQVISGGFTVLDQTVTDIGSSPTTFADYEFNFLALGASTTISFTDVSTTTTNVDGVLDNVRMYLDDGEVDVLNGENGADTIYGGFGDDIISGGAGGDFLSGRGSDTLSFADSTAAVTVNLGAQTASGGYAAGDVFYGFENLTGSAFSDTLTGDSANNVIDGGNGSDTYTLTGNWSSYTINQGLRFTGTFI